MSIKTLQEAIAHALLNHNEQMAQALQAALDRLTQK